MTKVKIIDFQDQYAKDFCSLNIEWLEAYFYVEDYDKKVLNNPKPYIIDKGGIILFAIAENKVAGTLALINRESEGIELSKMAVTKDFQGLRIGQKLIYAAIHRAGELGAHRLFLDSNTKLKPALNLYKKVGFTEIPMASTPYERGNIRMEIKL
ncbi:MAG: GNAT family N-acetyltransferase [Crocinitomicaceae bacterium]